MSNSADLIMDFPRTTTSKKKQQRMVRFSTMSAMVCYNDRGSDNTTARWYTNEDEQRFREDNQDEAISYVMHKETRGSISKNNAPMICPVGLEQQLISREYTKKRSLMKRMAKFTVLREQARISSHNEHPGDKQDRIATASIQCTQWAREQATTIGAFQARK